MSLWDYVILTQRYLDETSCWRSIINFGLIVISAKHHLNKASFQLGIDSPSRHLSYRRFQFRRVKMKMIFRKSKCGNERWPCRHAMPPCPAAMPCCHAMPPCHAAMPPCRGYSTFLLVSRSKKREKMKTSGGSMLQTSFHPNWPFEKLKLNREVRQMKARVCPSGKL